MMMMTTTERCRCGRKSQAMIRWTKEENKTGIRNNLIPEAEKKMKEKRSTRINSLKE